jgi:hypothetical protein
MLGHEAVMRRLAARGHNRSRAGAERPLGAISGAVEGLLEKRNAVPLHRVETQGGGFDILAEDLTGVDQQHALEAPRARPRYGGHRWRATRRTVPSQISPPGIRPCGSRRRGSASPAASRRKAPRHMAASDKRWRNPEAGKPERRAGGRADPSSRSRHPTKYGRPEADPCCCKRRSPTCGRCRPEHPTARRARRRKLADRPHATSESQKRRSRATARPRIRPSPDGRLMSPAPEARPGCRPRLR